MAFAPKNPNPEFKAPSYYKEPPRHVVLWKKWALEKELHHWVGFNLLRRTDGKRGLYTQNYTLLAAIVQCMLHHLNLCTHHVQCSYEQIADEIGASTTSKAGNKSISRVSRFFKRVLIPLKLVECTQVWDKENHCFVPTHIQVTPKFFEMLGMDLSQVEQVQEIYKVSAVKALIPEADAGTISIDALQRIKKRNHFERAFEKRRDKLGKAKLKGRAHKLHGEQQKHGYSKTVNEIASDIWSRMSHDERTKITSKELRKLTNREAARLRAIHSPPQ